MPARRIVILSLLLLAGAPSAQAATDLQLHGARFRVSAEWRTSAGAHGTAQAVPLTAETGLFWFFSPTNIELVVKVIDACTAPYERYWVFASGLTDTDVELVVEDTWSGQVESYHHPAGTLFTPFADTASFAVCHLTGPACGHGSQADIAASPRPDFGAESLALLIGDGVAAETALYERLHEDLAAIRTADTALAAADFYNVWWDARSMILTLTAEAHSAAKAGSYDEWSCLNDWYRGTVQHVFEFSPAAVIAFEGYLNPYRVGPDYTALPGVTNASANHIGYPASGPTPTSGLCAIADGAAFDYFFEGTVWRYYRVPSAGATPLLVGTWGGQAPAPAWGPRLDECYERLLEAALPGQASSAR